MKSKTLKMEEEEEDGGGRSEFAFAVTRIAVAQICHSVGFRGTQRSALEIMTEVGARYLRAMAESAAASAASFGRTQSNLFDVVRALEDLSFVQGFPGAGNANRTLLASSTLTDLAEFVKYTDEIPFAKPIPGRCPPPKKSSVGIPGGGLNSSVSSRFMHVPRWLPAIPEMRASEIDKAAVAEKEERSGIDNGVGSRERVDGGCLVGGKMGTELPEKRAKVRFKMGMGVGGREEGIGVDLRSGVCRGGKRVSFMNRTDEEVEEDRNSGINNDNRKSKGGLLFKRPRQ